MATQHVVVDGSNIATEGRSTPSLLQLEEAVSELRKELPEAEVTVVVDATFAHRIDGSELDRFEKAALRGEYVYPPAGAIGRGDAFLLRIAERVEGIVLSNDSFQEFHGEHEWLFDRGRLLGATPVPGVGWIFIPRTPVRGPRSRVAVRDAGRAKERVVKAIAQATKEVVEPAPEPVQPTSSRRTRGRTTGQSPQAVNDPMTFISFIAEHPLGEELEGVVDGFTSHGAVVHFGDVRCYVPLSGLGDPAPRAAREVLHRGETRTFVITALDPFRRGVELALPGVGVVSGRPSDETVAAEVRMARSPAKKALATKTARATKAPRATKAVASISAAAAPPARVTAVAKAAPTKAFGSAKAPAAKRPAAKAPAAKAPAAKAPASNASAAKAPAGRRPAGKAPAAKAPAAKAPATRTTAAKAAGTRGVAKKAASATAASKVTGTINPAAKKSAPGKAATGARAGGARAGVKKAAGATAAPAKAAPAKAAPDRATTARKTSANGRAPAGGRPVVAKKTTSTRARRPVGDTSIIPARTIAKAPPSDGPPIPRRSPSKQTAANADGASRPARAGARRSGTTGEPAPQARGRSRRA
ncbi:MAG: hypothetical protein JWO62_2902 [Acidimicrobiaceae bacterium]|nr:hypothetical protein [Acidimicrobiaceae bacterium]